MHKIGFNMGLSKGGPAIFIDRLKKSLKKLKLNKISYFFDPSINIFLCNNRKFNNIWNKPIVFRIDGVPHKKFLITKKFDENTNIFYKKLKNANGIIYQSKFAKLINEKFFDINKSIPNTVIYNGINLKEFNRQGQNLRKKLGINTNDIVFIASGNFRNKNKRLESIIDNFNIYKTKRKINKYLIILGVVNKKLGISRNKLNNKNIILAGKINVSYLPNWYRTGDIFLHFAYIDICPNSVIEAIASGLPVLCTNSSGTRELINETGCGLVVNTDKINKLEEANVWNPPQLNQKLILNGIKKIIKDKKKILKKTNLDSINIDKVAKKYSDFINKIKI